MNKKWTHSSELSISFLALFFFCCGLIGSAISKAQTCQSLYSESMAFKIQGSEGLPFKLEEVQSLTRRINQMAGPFSVTRLQIELQKTNVLYSSLDPIQGILKLGIGEAKSFDRRHQAIFSHEMGHAIVATHLKFQINDKRQTLIEALSEVTLKESEIKTSTEYQARSLEIRKLEVEKSRAKATGDSVRLKALTKEVKEKTSSRDRDLGIENLGVQSKRLQELNELILPYDELIADLTAVLVMNDGKVIADALGFSPNGVLSPLRSQNPQGSRPRDFTGMNHFKNWNHENPDIGAYTSFDPVRGALWSWIQKAQISKTQYSQLFQAVLVATNQHLEMRMAREEKNEHQGSATKLNQDYFRKIVEQLKAQGQMK